jgi:hypothetical protein
LNAAAGSHTTQHWAAMDIRRKKWTLRAKNARYPGFLSDTAALSAVQLLCPYRSEKPHQESLTPIRKKGGGRLMNMLYMRSNSNKY